MSTPTYAVMLLSFGGPNKAEDVVPFLENVTRGRGIPRERLEVVGEHYFKLGGKSPINEQNLQIIDNLRRKLPDVPVYFGNRNWEPFVEDTMVQMVRDGYTNIVIAATSAWGGYSGCGQYQEDIRRALAAVREAGLEEPQVRRLGHFYSNPAFIAEFAAAVDRAMIDGAELLFTAHSVPTAADDASGPPSFGGNLYSAQVREAARLITEASGYEGEPTLVWQSRSGSPRTPWLEPDVCDYIEERAAGGDLRPIVLCPVGFITDHMEVAWDLDTEAKAVCEEHGITLVRTETPGLSEAFASMLAEMITSPEAVEACGRVPSLGATTQGSPCAPGCCV